MKIKLLLVASILFFLPLSVSAAEVVTNSHSDIQVYPEDFDVLALDFTLFSEEESDALTDLTLTYSGSALDNFDYKNLMLWADRGDEGFQGWGFDEPLVQPTLIGNRYIFENVNIEFIGSQRFFVSLESMKFASQRNIQFLVDNPNDSNGDGLFQSGETGIFLESGVISVYLGGNHSRTISFKTQNVDIMAPKAVIDDLSIDPLEPTNFLVEGNKITFTGEARDRTGGIVKIVKLFIGNEITVDALLNSEANYTTWSAQYEFENGIFDYDIRVMSQDGVGNQVTSAPYYIHIDTRTVDPSKSQLISSKSEVIADEADPLILSVNMQTADGEILSYREVTFDFEIGNEFIGYATALTDGSGIATLTQSFGLSGLLVVTAKYDNAILGQSVITLLPPENEQPQQEEPGSFKAGDLVKGSLDAVYYYSSLGTRHVFVDQKTYVSWYGEDFSTVKTISDTDLASIPLGDPVGYRPGSMITAPSVNEVYLVTRGQVLRHLPSESFVQNLFGSNWNKLITDLQESLLFTYSISSPYLETDTINLDALSNSNITIDDELLAR